VSAAGGRAATPGGAVSLCSRLHPSCLPREALSVRPFTSAQMHTLNQTQAPLSACPTSRTPASSCPELFALSGASACEAPRCPPAGLLEQPATAPPPPLPAFMGRRRSSPFLHVHPLPSSFPRMHLAASPLHHTTTPWAGTHVPALPLLLCIHLFLCTACAVPRDTACRARAGGVLCPLRSYSLLGRPGMNPRFCHLDFLEHPPSPALCLPALARF
jgi:hypothetical protein